MKDIQITVKQQKREIKYILISLLLAIGVNVYAIISYGTDWKELYTQWFAVLVLAVALYFLIALLRYIFWLVSVKLIKGRK